MGLHPRTCLNHYHLICLAALVSISLALIIVGGSLPAWCIRYGNTFECHSLLHSDRGFSCLFKLLPAGIVLSLILSLFMFIVLIIGQVYVEYTGIAKKEYQIVARCVNIFALSLAIILIMTVLLQWSHPPANASKSISIALIPSPKADANGTVKEEPAKIVSVEPDNPSYLNAIGVKRHSILDYHKTFHHGPNLFFASFIIVFIALLGFIMGHRVSYFT